MCIWPCATYGKIRWKLYATYRTRLLRIYSTVQPKASYTTYTRVEHKSNGNVIINILYVRLVMLMRFRSFKIVVSNWFVLFFFLLFHRAKTILTFCSGSICVKTLHFVVQKTKWVFCALKITICLLCCARSWSICHCLVERMQSNHQSP